MMERLPSFERLRTGLVRPADASDGGNASDRGRRRRHTHEEVDVRAMGLAQRQAFVERVLRVTDEDNERFLRKLRPRIDRANIQIPTVEVRFRGVNVQAECHVGTRALPTLANVSLDVAESLLGRVGVKLGKRKTLHILKDGSGVVRPSRMTLLLGPPSSGKTTLLLALVGKLDPTLEVSREVTYNGYGLDEFVPEEGGIHLPTRPRRRSAETETARRRGGGWWQWRAVGGGSASWATPPKAERGGACTAMGGGGVVAKGRDGCDGGGGGGGARSDRSG
ncbi:ABC transporter G family member 38 [Zea mays]|uniref:ABC transporter G family member 38 n=1 Tax=Zea mays TaxID=4577 RepID=A0A3L6EQB4_MAIZE|nr:ABC transporter G family member 38 [Zea mays]